MRWRYASLAGLLFLTAGLVAGLAIADGGTVLWAVMGLALLLGCLATVTALPTRVSPAVEPGPVIAWKPAGAPPLGQMLVSYGLITQADLDAALVLQRESGKRLGQTLVTMKLVTHAQVAEVLEEQLSRREGRLRWGAREGLVE